MYIHVSLIRACILSACESMSCVLTGSQECEHVRGSASVREHEAHTHVFAMIIVH